MKKVLSLLLVLGIAQWWFSDQTIHTPSYDIDFDFIEFDGGHHGIFTGVKPQITQLLEEKLDGIF